ncbi:MAG TPA: hypothetical protein DCO77_12840, partial [Nitrospiraceae bacterium]|nr:hypothetical protein [Nitrospiraceae bacterium]
SRAAQGWAYIETVIAGAPPEPILRTFDDAREDVRDGDYVVIMYPAGKSLLSHGADWLYKYTKGGPSKLDSGDGTFPDSVAGLVLYGLSESGGATVPSQPYYAVHYSLGVIPPPPKTCADGAKNLIRTESITTETPDPDLGKPVLNCVLDFQVAFGLDTDDKGGIDEWDNGGNTTAKDYTPKDLTKRLRQLRVYALVQEGKRDRDYTYANPDPAYSTKVDEVRVGDLTLEGGAVGQDFKLTAEQRKYRWRVVSFTMTSKNMK